jgi:hypothetical protein
MQSQGGDLFSPYLYRARNGVERFFKKFKLCRRIVQPDQREGYDDPAVGAILALAAAQISAAEDWLCKIARSVRSPSPPQPGDARPRSARGAARGMNHQPPFPG